MSIDFKKFSGTGMTSDSSREKLISILKDEGIKNSKVLRSMQLIPRHIYVDEAISSKAYDNTALPIGKSQTISHPMIVAKITESEINLSFLVCTPKTLSSSNIKFITGFSYSISPPRDKNEFNSCSNSPTPSFSDASVNPPQKMYLLSFLKLCLL